MINLTEIIVAVIGLLGLIVTTVLVPYIKEKTTAEQREEALMWVNIAVQAAEMIFKGSGHGLEKFEYVKDFLAARGYTFDEAEVKAMIESAVLELKATLLN